MSHNLDPWESVYTDCDSLLIFLNTEEDRDEVVLEDLFCHFQKMVIFVPPKLP